MKTFSICLLIAGAQAVKLMQDTAAGTAAGTWTETGPATGPATGPPATFDGGDVTGTAAAMDALMDMGPMFGCEGTSCDAMMADPDFDDTMLGPIDPVTGMPLPPPGPMDPSMTATAADLGLDEVYDDAADSDLEAEE